MFSFLGDLYISLRGRETVQESLQETFDREKRGQEVARKDIEQRCHAAETKVKQVDEQKRILKDKLDVTSNELRTAQTKLNKLTPDGAEDDKTTFQMDKLVKEKADLEQEMKEIKDSLDEKLKLLLENESKGAKVSEENENMTTKVNELEKQKKSFQQEVGAAIFNIHISFSKDMR